MRPTTKTIQVTGYTDWIPVDYTLSAFNVGVQVMPSVGASVVWSVQTTLDDPYTTLIPKAVPAPDNLKTGTDYAIGNIVTPCRAVRLAATIASGTVDFTVVQGRK
jgi:hypothetical protein